MANIYNWLLDHSGIGVADIYRSAAFYQALLAPLNVGVVMRISRRFEPAQADDADLAGVAFGIDYPVFWLDIFHPHSQRQHVAFRAVSREQVRAFYRAGLAAGGVDNGVPGLRTDDFSSGYYAAFVLDPDGNNIEAVLREGR
ncbi:VOC family protein [Serratia rhizosphaerae]|uniref:VOC family protein n=1 Tax=Serratia sp. MYb239 TaxID=2033438 RepID=UPI0018F88E65|nr:VOC family protein [Serratia sp. MYb239]MCA4823768.1 VOC family protein [Serratia rubidaea]